jgi:signal peptidase I
LFRQRAWRGGQWSRRSATATGLLTNKLTYQLGEPRRGDIVMFRYPLKPERTFVMRVVAEEYDEVRIAGGHVYRNGFAADESFVAAENRDAADWGPEVVPEGYYFVLGDRRNASSDSRHWGFVPKKYILGRVAYRYWPIRSARRF